MIGSTIGEPYPYCLPVNNWMPYDPGRTVPPTPIWPPLPDCTIPMQPDELATLRIENARLHALVMAQAEQIASMAKMLADRAGKGE